MIELHDRDKKASRFEERSLALQDDTLRALTQLHGGSTVSREDFLQNQQESHNLMRGLGHGIGELWREQASTTGAVEVLNQITMQASDRAHGDVVALKESVDGVESAVSSGTREIHGPRDPQLDISFFTSSPQDFFEALSAYKKGMLTDEADYKIKKIIDEKLSPRTLRRQVDALLESMPRSQRISTNLSTTLIDCPSLFIKNPHNYTQDLETLSALAAKHGIPELRNFVKNMKGLLTLSKSTQNTPLQKNTLVQYTNEGLLTSHMQHAVKAQHREARTGGSLVDINYSMLDLLGQGDVSNHYLDIISTEIEETNEHLVDLNHLVADFACVVEGGFRDVVESLNQVSVEIAFTRAAVVAELHHLEQTTVNIGNAIKREVAYGNRLLERMVWLKRNSHKNDAQQFFEDGFKCLKRAATRADVEDAHAAFDDGTKKVRSSVENQYGAGLAAEFLDNFAEAAERYRKAANRSVDDSPEIASISLEGLARINQKQNNLPEAITHSTKAVELNSDNLPALYDHAHYLALSGRTDEVLEILIDLIPRDEKYFHRMIVDSAFQHIEIQQLEEKLWDGKLVRSPTVLRQILLDFLILDDVDRAFDIFCYLFQFYPRALLHPKIWIPELIEKIKDQAESFFEKLITKEISSVSQRYAKTLILAQFNVSDEVLMGTFLKELEDDPAYYQKDAVMIRQNLEKNPLGDVKKLVTKIQPLLSVEFDWLKL